MANVDNVLFVDMNTSARAKPPARPPGRPAVDSANGRSDRRHSGTRQGAPALVAAIDDLKYLRSGRPPLPAAVAVAGGCCASSPYHHPGRQGRHGRQGPRPARRLHVTLFKKVEMRVHQPPLRRWPAIPSPREVTPIQTYLRDNLQQGRPAGPPDRLCHRHPRRPRRFRHRLFDKTLTLDL